jgi:hypothetical protein
MPSASEFSLTPSANVTIGGTNVAEDCSPGGINDALRYVAAVCRDTFDKIGGVGTYLLSSGGTLTGDIFRSTRGAYLHHAGSAQTDGRVMFLPEGSARPAGSEGMVVFYYA